MLAYVWRRLIHAVPVLIGASILTFAIVELLPGNAARQLAGAEATGEQVAELEVALGLDRPAVARFAEWLGRALRGDLGTSLVSRQPVSALIGERLPVTLELVLLAFVLALALAIPAALISARWPHSFTDRVGAVLSMIGLSTANYVMALALVLIFAVSLHALPSFGYVSVSESALAHARSLVLPSLAIALPLLAFYARFLRGDLMAQLHREDYILAVKARGFGPWHILTRHALPSSLFGLLTLVGLNFGSLVGGTVIIEQIFALPGLGQLLMLSIGTRDVVVVQAIVLILTAITVIANLLVDLLYALLDPRVGYGR